MVSVFIIGMAVLAAAACYRVAVVVKSARGNVCWMGWRYYLGLALAIVAAPLLALVVGLAMLAIWINEGRLTLHRSAKADDEQRLARCATAPMALGQDRERHDDLCVDTVIQPSETRHSVGSILATPFNS